MPDRAEVAELIARFGAERELAVERIGEYSFAVTLPGSRKLSTVCQLMVGDHALRVAAFVIRAPEESRERFWAWLLRRNARMYAVAFAIDAAGDVYLAGRIGLSAVTDDELDRVLGAVLTYADESFDTLLEIGFSTAIRREWVWRRARGEPTGNLAAFRHLAPPDRVDPDSGA